MSLDGRTYRKNVLLNDNHRTLLDYLTELTPLSESEIIRLGIFLAHKTLCQQAPRHLEIKSKLRNAIATYENFPQDTIENNVFQ